MSDPSKTTREIGHLIIVVSKARHLTNKRSIAKQDPYVTCNYNGTNQRTKAIKNAGQRAEWDAEMRYPVIEILDAHQPPPDPTAKPVPVAQRKIKGGKTLRCCCYADDSREPILIGEAFIPLDEVFTTGETDEWFQLLNKDRFSGEVFLELTYYSSEAPPKKKPKASVIPAANYGGAGSFTSSSSSSSSSLRGHPDPYATMRAHPTGGEPGRGHSPGSAYFDPRVAANPVDHLAQGFEQMGVVDSRWETQYGQPIDQYTPRPGSRGYSTLHPEPHYSSEYASSIVPERTGYSTHDHYLPQPSGFTSYDSGPSTLAPRASVASHIGRRARQSMPVASSGFMPLNTRSPSRASSLAPVPYHDEFDPGLPPANFPAAGYPAPAPVSHDSSHSPMHHSQYNEGPYYDPSYGGESPYQQPTAQSPYSYGGESPHSYRGESPAHLYGGESPNPYNGESPNPYGIPPSNFHGGASPSPYGGASPSYYGGASPSQYAASPKHYVEQSSYSSEYANGPPRHDSGYTSFPPPLPPKDNLSTSTGPGGRRPLPQAPAAGAAMIPFQPSPSPHLSMPGSYSSGNAIAFPSGHRSVSPSPSYNPDVSAQRRYSMTNSRSYPEGLPPFQGQVQPQQQAHPPTSAHNAMAALRERTRHPSLPGQQQPPVFNPHQLQQLQGGQGHRGMPVKRPSLPLAPVPGGQAAHYDDARWFVPRIGA